MRPTVLLLLVVGFGNYLLAQTPSEPKGVRLLVRNLSRPRDAARHGRFADQVQRRQTGPVERAHGLDAGSDENVCTARRVDHAFFSQDRNQRCGFRRAGRVPGSQQQTSEPVAHPLALAVRM